MSRADLDVMTRKPIDVTLAGRKFSITPQPRKQSRVWKARFFEVLNERGGVESVITALGAAIGKDTLSDTGSMAGIASWALWFADTGADEVLDTIYDYDPAAFTDDDREHCDEHGHTDEFVAALVAIIRLVYAPFGALAGAVGLKTKAATLAEIPKPQAP